MSEVPLYGYSLGLAKKLTGVFGSDEAAPPALRGGSNHGRETERFLGWQRRIRFFARAIEHLPGEDVGVFGSEDAAPPAL